ncbi:MAG: oligosaccharide flippase family protein, partial [Firmicutes bacterium]|nr:oligosaccharide flippase family protein [Bacillota bacterium]
LFLTSHFRPRFAFSIERLKRLWSYGIKVLGTSLLDMLYDKIRPLVVGIKFNTVDLAYYEKGSSYPGMINSTLSSTLASVLFPIIAAAQDDITKVKLITQKYIRVASFLIFPSLFGLAAVANNLVLWMLTEKWMQAVPYMQIFCINYMFMLLQTGNLQAINAIGRSDIVLKLAIIKKTINFILLFIVILVSQSPLWLAALGILTSLIAFCINSFTNSKLLKYGFKEQLLDILPNLLSAILMACIVYLIGNIHLNLFPLLIVQIVAGILIYSGLAFFTHNSNLKYCLDTFRAVTKK